MLQVNIELARDLHARKQEVNMVPHRINRYAQDYIDFQTGQGLEMVVNAPSSWVACGDDFGAPFGVDA